MDQNSDTNNPLLDSNSPSQSSGPMNQPVLRRQRTSLRRQNLLEMNQSSDQFKKQVAKSVFTNTVIGIYLWLCLALSDVEYSCSVKHTYDVCSAFILWVLLPTTAIKLVALFFSNLTHIQYIVAGAEFYWFIMYGVFDIYCLVILFKFWPTVCFAAFDINFMNYCCIMILGILNGLILSFLACLFVCCAPCIGIGLYEIYKQNQQSQATKQDAVTALFKTTIQKFGVTAASSECVICLMPFEESDMVTPLPCDIRHHFHTECIEGWVQQNNVCPLCKTPVTKEQLEQFERDFESRIANQVHNDDFREDSL